MHAIFIIALIAAITSAIGASLLLAGGNKTYGISLLAAAATIGTALALTSPLAAHLQTVAIIAVAAIALQIARTHPTPATTQR